VNLNRAEEVRALLRLSPAEVEARAGRHLVVCEDLPALHLRFAADMAAEIRACAERGGPLRLIVPVGPTGQYPILADAISREGLLLEHCWLFFMDEYATADGRAVSVEHPLCFKAVARSQFLQRLPAGCGLRPERVLFPDEQNIDRLGNMIAELGGIDVCYGGIGIHGHVAFNEPEPGVRGLGPRLVRLNDFTVTINALRAHVGGNLACFPRQAFTLGMREILGARKIRLFCRNGVDYDWANTILRLALFGQPGDDYPVTHIRGRDYVITTDRATLATPANLI